MQTQTDYLEKEKDYEEFKKTILDKESEGYNADSDSEADEDEDEDESDEESMQLKDETQRNPVKIVEIHIEGGEEMVLCDLLLGCCSRERSYQRCYALFAQRCCVTNKVHQENFEKLFVEEYSTIHELETSNLRNTAKFFAHLLATDAIHWHVLSCIRLTREDTSSSSCMFIKILFQELSEHLGINLLNQRLNHPTMHNCFQSIFPKDNPKNTRFCINFFRSIGLGALAQNLREFLKNMQRQHKQRKLEENVKGCF